MLKKISNLVKWAAILGTEPQAFLSAKWVQGLLNRTSESKKRIWALRMISLSPHYFLDEKNPAYRGMKFDEYLEATFADLSKSRFEIYEKILKPHLDANFDVLEYGCGPGFLVKAVSPHVKTIRGIDISTGALDCARIINSAQNLTYLTANDEGLAAIPDESLDVIYSYAVIQHVSDEIFEMILENCRKKLKPNGKLVLHIQLIDEIWRTEADWKADKSLQGRLKFRYGLHCFGRTKEAHLEIVSKHGFKNIEMIPVSDLVENISVEEKSQSLLIAFKS